MRTLCKSLSYYLGQMNRYSLVAWGDCSEGGIPCQRQDGRMDEQDTRREDTDSSVAWPFRNTWLSIAGRILTPMPLQNLGCFADQLDNRSGVEVVSWGFGLLPARRVATVSLDSGHFSRNQRPGKMAAR